MRAAGPTPTQPEQRLGVARIQTSDPRRSFDRSLLAPARVFMGNEFDQLRIAEADPEELPEASPIESVAMNDAAIRADWVGRTVDLRFALLEWLGGSAKRGVFLTVRQGIQRAAIKLIVASGADAEQYLAQWEMAKGLSHPNLMPIFETGRYTIDGTEMVYIVSEHATSDLAQEIRDKGQDAHAARDTFSPVLDALSHLHEKGFVHGHIRPSNILRVGSVVRLSTDEFLLAGQGPKAQMFRGVYDAPEIAGGKITPAADVWSLGMTLTEALTQRWPIMDQEPGADPVLPDSLPQPFHSLVLSCLRLDPGSRCTINDFRSQLAFATALLSKGSPDPKTRVVPLATEPAPADPIPALPEPALFADARSTPFDSGRRDVPFQPAAASTLFETRYDDDEETSGSRIPFVPILLGIVVLAALVVVVLVRSDRLPLSWPFTKPETAVASQSAPQPKTETPPSDAQSAEPGATGTQPAQAQPSSSAATTQPSTTQPPATQPVPSQSPVIQPQAATNPSGTGAQAGAAAQPQAPTPAQSQAAPMMGQSRPPQDQQPALPANAEGAVAERVMPNVSPSARVSMHGPVAVTIRVTADHNGRVEDASYVSPGPGNYFARISQRAAEGWRFDPPRHAGRSLSSVWILHFYFTPRNTEVSVTQEGR